MFEYDVTNDFGVHSIHLDWYYWHARVIMHSAVPGPPFTVVVGVQAADASLFPGPSSMDAPGSVNLGQVKRVFCPQERGLQDWDKLKEANK